nr:hypothetical protein [uncultured archaeon]
MKQVGEYKESAEERSKEEKLKELLRIIERDPKKIKTAFKYAISAKLSTHEQMGLLLEIVKEKEEVLDATLSYLKKA